MSAELIITLIILVILGWLIWKGSKQARAIAAFILLLGVIRILESQWLGSGLTDFIRESFQAIAYAFGNIAEPIGVPQLIVTVVIIVGLILLIWKGNSFLRTVAGFILIYTAIRIVEVLLIGDGFSDFMRNLFLGISDAFEDGARVMP